MQANVIIGLVFSLFGLSLILFKRTWGVFANGLADAHAAYHNLGINIDAIKLRE